MLRKELENSIQHHAYCIVGDKGNDVEIIKILADRHGIERANNADYYRGHFEVFTIEDSRQIKSLHETRPVTENAKKIFIISINGITVEAQNALLKLLEEPASYAHFFIIVPNIYLLLPTVKSRLYIINTKFSDTSTETYEEVKRFLSSSMAKRLEIVKKFSDDISKENRTKNNAINFLNALQAEIREKRGIVQGYKALEAIDKALKYMNDRSPSIKMLLDYVALSL